MEWSSLFGSCIVQWPCQLGLADRQRLRPMRRHSTSNYLGFEARGHDFTGYGSRSPRFPRVALSFGQSTRSGRLLACLHFWALGLVIEREEASRHHGTVRSFCWGRRLLCRRESAASLEARYRRGSVGLGLRSIDCFRASPPSFAAIRVSFASSTLDAFWIA